MVDCAVIARRPLSLTAHCVCDRTPLPIGARTFHDRSRPLGSRAFAWRLTDQVSYRERSHRRRRLRGRRVRIHRPHYPDRQYRPCDSGRLCGVRRLCAPLLGGRLWHDDHLFREGAMNPADIGDLIRMWERFGLVACQETDGGKSFRDLCVVEHMFGGPTPRLARVRSRACLRLPQRAAANTRDRPAALSDDVSRLRYRESSFGTAGPVGNSRRRRVSGQAPTSTDRH